MRHETVWRFKTARFLVTLRIEPDYGYQYDGDDPDGETQARLDNGDYLAFDSVVTVYLDGAEIASDSLGGSVYDANSVDEFWTAHRDPNPMNRNCSIMRGKHPAGPNVTIVHYFPDMVRAAIDEARKHVCSAPRLRCAA